MTVLENEQLTNAYYAFEKSNNKFASANQLYNNMKENFLKIKTTDKMNFIKTLKDDAKKFKQIY